MGILAATYTGDIIHGQAPIIAIPIIITTAIIITTIITGGIHIIITGITTAILETTLMNLQKKPDGTEVLPEVQRTLLQETIPKLIQTLHPLIALAINHITIKQIIGPQ